ncbi:MAG: flagellar assembly protein FliW [Deltaproteobacteria bacterium]|nr:flagellar assembly protein FliW [Deltaproteobacteria bacterium]MCL5880535.1 flagellar assembly protein FliW [Deltaproteobacteria bacterium]MDA8304041.1 flagellar assembly protein FliW [Deltaproteobacteria bacterium]
MNSESEILVKSVYYPQGLAVEKSKIIEFVKPILGFDTFKNFCILNIDKEKNVPFFILQSIENEKLCFIITDPNLFFKDYSVQITDEEKNLLSLDNKADAIIFVIATLSSDFSSSTVNLKGPIVINIKNNRALQTVLNNDIYSVRQKLSIKKNEVIPG